MFMLRLAMKNVLRQYGRTGLSMVSIVVSVAVVILGRGVIKGTTENVVRAQIDSVSGHVLAVPADYPTAGVRHPVDKLLSLDDATKAWLDASTQGWTTRTLFAPRIIRGTDAIQTRAYGFEPDTDEQVFPRDAWRVVGNVPRTADDGVLISRGVSRVLEAKEGGRLIFQVRTPAGALNALEIPISGVVTTGNPMIDRSGVFVPRPLVNKLLQNAEQFSHLSIRLADRHDSDAVALALQQRLGKSARVRTWLQEAQGLIDIQVIRQRTLDLIALALLAMAAAGIANTVLMAAHERVREIGTLRAMGLTRAGTVRLFVLEGLIMGTVGGGLGALLGGWYNWKLSVDGIDLSALVENAGKTGAYDSIPMTSMLYTESSLAAAVGAAAVGLLIAVLASVYPALLASRKPPAEAVRTQ